MAFEFDYQFLEQFFTHLWETNSMKAFSRGLKILLVGAVVIRFSYQVVNNYTGAGGKNKFPLSLNSIFHVLGVIGAILSYDVILPFMDSLLSIFFSNFGDWDNKQIVSATEIADPESVTDLSWTGALIMMAERIVDFFLNPTYLISQMLIFLLWIVEYVIIAIFIGERFFMLFILKLVGPTVFALSLFPRFSQIFWNWVELYVRWYLLILPYMLVNVICNMFLEEINVLFGGMPGSELVTDGSMAIVFLPFLMILLFLKLKFYAAGKKLFSEMITIAKNDDLDDSQKTIEV